MESKRPQIAAIYHKRVQKSTIEACIGYNPVTRALVPLNFSEEKWARTLQWYQLFSALCSGCVQLFEVKEKRLTKGLGVI